MPEDIKTSGMWELGYCVCSRKTRILLYWYYTIVIRTSQPTLLILCNITFRFCSYSTKHIMTIRKWNHSLVVIFISRMFCCKDVTLFFRCYMGIYLGRDNRANISSIGFKCFAIQTFLITTVINVSLHNLFNVWLIHHIPPSFSLQLICLILPWVSIVDSTKLRKDKSVDGDHIYENYCQKDKKAVQ